MTPRSSKILITEDEPVVALDLERRLRKCGFDCRCAGTGEDAVRLADEFKPDLVLMDICLADGIDGVEAADRIRSSHDIPIVYLTANADESTLARARLTNPASYLLKPFKERELQICIAMALANHALQRELRAARDHLEQRVAERTADLRAANKNLRSEIHLRKESEARVREQAALLDQAQDAILVRQTDGRLTYWNRSAERLYGIPAAEALGQAAAEILIEDPDVAATAIQTAQAHGAWTGELTHHNRNGDEIIVESRWTRIGDGTAFLIVNTDITTRKQIEAQFLRAQRLESVGALASGIAHDLNNVFTPLLMTAQILGQEVKDPKMVELADIILGSARRGADMVKQVLLFVRGMEAGRAPFRIEHLVKEVIHLLRETFPKSVHIRSSFPEGLWSVVGDATQLHQVLMNLCVNARDAMPDGGTLTIAIANTPGDDAFARAHAAPGNDRHICISITDTGTGMPPEVRARIFDPFFTTKAPGKGTGLGLSTVLAIAKAHGGFIDLQSAPGAGTTFRIYLPAVEEAGEAAQLPPEATPPARGEQILVADDEHLVRNIVRTSLEDHGYKVLTADDGADALSKFALHHASLSAAVIDLEMPNLGGINCVQAIRRIKPGCPILFVSGASADNIPLAQIEGLGASFLAKPFTAGALLASLHRCITVGTTAAPR